MARKIELKVVEFEEKDIPEDKTGMPDDWEPRLRYKEMIINVLKMPPKGDTFSDWDEQEKSRELISKLEGYDDEDEVILEDEEWRKIRDHLQNYGKRILRLNDYMLDMWVHIKDAETVKKIEAVKETG